MIGELFKDLDRALFGVVSDRKSSGGGQDYYSNNDSRKAPTSLGLTPTSVIVLGGFFLLFVIPVSLGRAEDKGPQS